MGTRGGSSKNRTTTWQNEDSRIKRLNERSVPCDVIFLPKATFYYFTAFLFHLVPQLSAAKSRLLSRFSLILRRCIGEMLNMFVDSQVSEIIGTDHRVQSYEIGDFYTSGSQNCWCCVGMVPFILKRLERDAS